MTTSHDDEGTPTRGGSGSDPSAYPKAARRVHGDVDALAAAAAEALAGILAETRTRLGRPARVSLTGGGAGLRTAALLAERDIDWDGVEVHLGDERFVPRDHAERNARQLAEALLDGPAAAATVVDWPAPGDRSRDGAVIADVDSAAADFAAAHPLPAGHAPYFDAFCLGMGGEGHVNSVFPHSPQVAEGAPDIMAVHDCPKPPPERMTYTLPVVRRARHVLFLVAGAEKAEAVAAVASGADATDVPAAGARGHESTTWFLDTASASLLPGDGDADG